MMLPLFDAATLNSRYYFQLVATNLLGAHGFFGIIQHFGWRKLRLVAQDENVFTAVSLCPLMKYAPIIAH